jgi:hypothetical protein
MGMVVILIVATCLIILHQMTIAMMKPAHPVMTLELLLHPITLIFGIFSCVFFVSLSHFGFH